MNTKQGAIIFLAVAVAALLAGCTSSPDTSITSTSTSTTAPTTSVAMTHVSVQRPWVSSPGNERGQIGANR